MNIGYGGNPPFLGVNMRWVGVVVSWPGCYGVTDHKVCFLDQQRNYKLLNLFVLLTLSYTAYLFGLSNPLAICSPFFSPLRSVTEGMIISKSTDLPFKQKQTTSSRNRQPTGLPPGDICRPINQLIAPPPRSLISPEAYRPFFGVNRVAFFVKQKTEGVALKIRA